MDIERQRRLHHLLDQALDLGGDEQREFLREACGHDEELFAEACRILAPDDDTLGELFDGPANLDLTLVDTVPERGLGLARSTTIPRNFGAYRILEPLGEGGMGRVFLAEQTQPFRRRVALKVMRSSLQGERARARFDMERRALSRLDHVNIGHILDAGTTGDGVPYFAMELLEGEPLLAYCDARRLGLLERLELVIAICRGVEHAHGKQILHLDLKPSNLLVTESQGRSVPKIIDFGVARVLDHPLDEGTTASQEQLMGTPLYMSPEALEGTGRLDARADVYSLGVLLYEVLIGVRPVDSKGLYVAQLVHRICRQSLPSMSQRWAELPRIQQCKLAHLRCLDRGSLGRNLEDDLDWIVRRALAREVKDRYPSASALAHELQCYLYNQQQPPMQGSESSLWGARRGRQGSIDRQHREEPLPDRWNFKMCISGS